jgi:hypothetical protein
VLKDVPNRDALIRISGVSEGAIRDNRG